MFLKEAIHTSPGTQIRPGPARAPWEEKGRRKERVNGGSERRGRPSPEQAGGNMAALAPALAAAAGRLQVKAAGTPAWRGRASGGAPGCAGVSGWPETALRCGGLGVCLLNSALVCAGVSHPSLHLRASAA